MDSIGVAVGEAADSVNSKKSTSLALFEHEVKSNRYESENYEHYYGSVMDRD